MTQKGIDYHHVRLRVLSSHNKKLDFLKDQVNSESNIKIYKNDIVKIAIAEFLDNNPDVAKFKETLEKHSYI